MIHGSELFGWKCWYWDQLCTYVYGSLVEGGLKESNIKKVNALVQLFWQIDGFGSNALLKKCESSILKMIT